MKKAEATAIQNGVYIKTSGNKGNRAVKTHNGATHHAWLWIERVDGVWFWIDPTWTDNLLRKVKPVFLIHNTCIEVYIKTSVFFLMRLLWEKIIILTKSYKDDTIAFVFKLMLCQLSSAGQST